MACAPCNAPFSRPAQGMVAFPARWPVYVIPCSHLLDPFYVRQLQPTFPFPRQPWPFESETRAPGTGLIRGSQCPTPTTTSLPTTWRR